MEAICPLCGEPVNPYDPMNYQRVAGWERKREAGGTNALALREPSQEWAHWLCVDRAKSGLSAQPSFL